MSLAGRSGRWCKFDLAVEEKRRVAEEDVADEEAMAEWEEQEALDVASPLRESLARVRKAMVAVGRVERH